MCPTGDTAHVGTIFKLWQQLEYRIMSETVANNTLNYVTITQLSCDNLTHRQYSNTNCSCRYLVT